MHELFAVRSGWIEVVPDDVSGKSEELMRLVPRPRPKRVQVFSRTSKSLCGPLSVSSHDGRSRNSARGLLDAEPQRSPHRFLLSR